MASSPECQNVGSLGADTDKISSIRHAREALIRNTTIDVAVVPRLGLKRRVAGSSTHRRAGARRRLSADAFKSRIALTRNISYVRISTIV